MTIGTDEWVAQSESRRQGYQGLTGPARQQWDRVPVVAKAGALALLVALVPLASDSAFVVRVGVNALLFALLALGLNAVVGYAGLLDLGYIAFYGFGAYSYALLSSDQLGIHLPTPLTVAIVVVASGLFGLLLGLPSRRLLGDYLAIVTLFFGQMFVQLTLTLDRIQPPWTDQPLSITGGPNGIAGLDPMNLFGLEFRSLTSYYFLLLVLLVLVVIGFHRLNASRTGRAWRAVREEPLAAELLSIPVNRVKLLAFVAGAAVAGLSGTIFAAVQLGVFPANFDLALLILVYVAVILGGAGSLPGVVLGAAVVSIVPELLRTPGYARLIFYGLLLVGLVVRLRPWWRLAVVVAGAVVTGALAHVVGAGAGLETAPPVGEGALVGALDTWLVLPANPLPLGNYAFLLLVVAVITVTRLRGVAQAVVLGPVLWLAALVWETRLVTEPSITRQLAIGAILVVMMITRPQGLFGTPRVEAV